MKIVEDINFEGPSELRVFENLPSDVDPKVTSEEMFTALLDHCRAGMEQIDKLSK